MLNNKIFFKKVFLNFVKFLFIVFCYVFSLDCSLPFLTGWRFQAVYFDRFKTSCVLYFVEGAVNCWLFLFLTVFLFLWHSSFFILFNIMFTFCNLVHFSNTVTDYVIFQLVICVILKTFFLVITSLKYCFDRRKNIFGLIELSLMGL